MKSALKIGEKIILNEIGTDKQTVFTIKEVIGIGASCIVYTAVYTDGEGNTFSVRLKEFYPEGTDIQRNGTSLEISDNERFSAMLSFFTSGYQKQLEFRNNSEQMNSISNVQGVYTGNNTRYIAMSCNNGSCINEDDEFTFTDIMRITAAVTRQIKAFHQNGYLYLDLKPNNIFLYPETPDMVMLFDFDSVISKENVRKHSEWLSYTEEWSAPELSRNKISKIDERADVYSIGALLLFLLFRRKPTLSDRRRFASWEEDIAQSVLSSESPETVRMVTNILQKTLTSSVSGRYESCDGILEVTDGYISRILAPKPYLNTFLPMGNNYFCGRDKEIAEIADRLKSDTFLVLHGIGGIGKSELAKHYALKYADNYDAVIFTRYSKSIRDTLLSDTNFPMVNCKQEEDEDDDSYFERKLHILQSICTPKHLIILDNFDTEECDDLEYLTGLQCKVIVTSRVNYSDVFAQIDIGIIADFGNIQKIFAHYYSGIINEYADKIIYALEGHTMGVELVSRQMEATGITAEEMYSRLTEQGVSATEDKVRNFKDGRISSKTALKHLEILFSVFGLPEELIYVLSYVSMVGTTPVPVEDFFEICCFEEDEKEYFHDAETRGWIQETDGKIQLHPLICEVLLSQIDPEIEDVWLLIKSLEEGADTLDELSGEKRYIREQVMFHTAKHIKGEPAILVTFLRKMEKVFVNYRKYANAEECLLKRMELSEIVWPDSPEQYKFEYFDLANYAEHQGEYERASKYRQKAEEICSESEMLVAKYFAADDYDMEIECALNLLKIAKSDRDFYDAYCFLSQTEDSYNGNKEIVFKYAEKELYYAECLLSKNENYDEMFDLLKNAAEACVRLTEYEKALQYYISADEYIDTQQLEDKVVHYSNLGYMYAACENKEKAVEYFTTAKELAEQHLTPEQPLYFEEMVTIAARLQDAFAVSNDSDYLYMKLKVQDCMLNAESDNLMNMNIHLNMAESLLILDEYDECEKQTYVAITILDEYFDDVMEETVPCISYIWQLLYFCNNEEWKSYYERLIKNCSELELYDAIDDNMKLLDNMELENGKEE